ncbi:MAG: DUF2147 domain-containing protein [Bacteroidales bacterium]|nr:DUF2147 domain-containing protein [Bacteroidales bacterium]
MKTIATILISFLFLNIFSQDANRIVGFWLTQDSDSQIKIFKATNGKYYGKIVWLDEPNEEDGTPKIDDKNPDVKLQTRPIMNLMLLSDFNYDEKAKNWSGGTIYDPQSGNTYKCNIWFEDDENILHVKGYIGISLIGRKVEWSREANQREQK